MKNIRHSKLLDKSFLLTWLKNHSTLSSIEPLCIRAAESSSKGQGDWANTEIQFKYEKLEFHDLFNRSMEIVFQKIQKWDI